MKKLFIISAILFLAACGTAVKLSSAAQADVERGSKLFPGLTLSELNQGKIAYEDNCGKCHGLIAPTKFAEEKWRKEVPPMAKKAKVDAATETLILKYVVTMSSATNK
jgi:cytochrome c5